MPVLSRFHKALRNKLRGSSRLRLWKDCESDHILNERKREMAEHESVFNDHHVDFNKRK